MGPRLVVHGRRGPRVTRVGIPPRPPRLGRGSLTRARVLGRGRPQGGTVTPCSTRARVLSLRPGDGAAPPDVARGSPCHDQGKEHTDCPRGPLAALHIHAFSIWLSTACCGHRPVLGDAGDRALIRKALVPSSGSLSSGGDIPITKQDSPGWSGLGEQAGTGTGVREMVRGAQGPVKSQKRW